MKQIKFGLVGLGRIGKIHFENIRLNCENASVIAVSNLGPDNVKWINKRGVKHIYDSFSSMMLNDEINAVIISSPTSLHSEHIIQAADAGKAIFCEKPIDLSLERVKKIHALVKELKIPFMVGFNRRYDPSLMKVKSDIKNGIIGKPQIIKITSRDPEPPSIDYIKTSGGLFLDMAIHDFDIACFMNQQKVISVYSSGTVFGNPDIKKLGDLDTAITTLTFENGSIASIDNSRKSAYGYDQRIEVFGNLGITASNNKLADSHYFADSNGIHNSNPLGFFIERYSESYLLILKKFIYCLLENKEISNNSRVGLNALLISLAAKKSFEENRVVELYEFDN